MVLKSIWITSNKDGSKIEREGNGKKKGCDWSGTEKKGGVHLPGNTQKGEVVKKLAADLFFLTIVFWYKICLPKCQ